MQARALLLLLLAILLALHFDFWRESRPRLLFGWLPEELAWRLAWMGLATIFLLVLTRRKAGEQPP